MPTTATSHRSRATLLDVAKSHANSRALSRPTRDTFAFIVDGTTYNIADEDQRDAVDDAFFEAACSCATRAGQSYSRRVMLSDLMALREAVYAGKDIRPKVTTMTIKVQGDADAMRRALLDFNHDGTRVVYASEV